MYRQAEFCKCEGTGKNIRKEKSDNRRQNFIIFKVTVTVKVGKKLVKAVAHFFNSKITDGCPLQSADIFGRALTSVLLQNSLRYLKNYGDLNIYELF